MILVYERKREDAVVEGVLYHAQWRGFKVGLVRRYEPGGEAFPERLDSLSHVESGKSLGM